MVVRSVPTMRTGMDQMLLLCWLRCGHTYTNNYIRSIYISHVWLWCGMVQKERQHRQNRKVLFDSHPQAMRSPPFTRISGLDLSVAEARSIGSRVAWLPISQSFDSST